jgi:hypothetical protein
MLGRSLSLVPQPAGSKFLFFAERFEKVVGVSVVMNRPVVSFNVGILFGLAKLNEIDADAAVCAPCQGHCANVWGGVGASNGFQLAAPFDEPI